MNMTNAEIARHRLGVGPVNPSHADLIKREQRGEVMTVQQASNARRESEYVARRNGVKEPLVQIWSVK